MFQKKEVVIWSSKLNAVPTQAKRPSALVEAILLSVSHLLLLESIHADTLSGHISKGGAHASRNSFLPAQHELLAEGNTKGHQSRAFRTGIFSSHPQHALESKHGRPKPPLCGAMLVQLAKGSLPRFPRCCWVEQDVVNAVQDLHRTFYAVTAS